MSIEVERLPAIKKDNWFRIVEDLVSQADIRINGSRPWDIKVRNTDFYKRILQEGSIGLGESYMEGWWECDALDVLFEKILLAKLDEKAPKNLHDLARIAGARLFNLQSRKRAWIVGKEHYDIGNDLFFRMLDPYMQYSCGYWKNATDLYSAQQEKLRMLCEKLQLQPGMTLLDIGCGWGGLAEFAAKNYNVQVTGDTIGANKSDNNVDPWINKYIFPNGCLPSVRQIATASEPHFVIEDWHNFGADYDLTLMAWHTRFNRSWPQISDHYTVSFKRMFNYYLTSCAGAFRARDIQLWQVLFSRGVSGGLYVYR